MVGVLFDTLSRSFGETIYETQFKSKLIPFLVQAMRDLVSNNLKETSIPKIGSFLETNIVPICARDLLEENRTLLMCLVIKEIALQLERRLNSQRWSGEIIELLEKDYRRLSAYLAEQSELQSKEILLRVTFYFNILSCETSEEALLFCTPTMRTNGSSVLGEAEVRRIIELRSDWPDNKM